MNDPISSIRQALAGVDNAFTRLADAAQQRRADYRRMGMTPGPDVAAMLANQFGPDVPAAARQAQAAIDAAQDEARAAVNQALKDYDASDEGTRYYQVLPALATLTSGDNADQLAARLTAALDQDNVPVARALLDLAQKQAKTSPALYQAMNRAQAAIVPAQVKAAQDLVDQVAGIRFRFDTAAYKYPETIQDLASGVPLGRSGYSVAWVLGDTDQPNDAIQTVR